MEKLHYLKRKNEVLNLTGVSLKSNQGIMIIESRLYFLAFP